MPSPDNALQPLDTPVARPCAHCMENGSPTGICRKGLDGHSCATCMQGWSRARLFGFLKASSIPEGQGLIGKCMVCFGRGTVEGASFKIRNYFPFFFAISVVAGIFLFFFLHPEQDKLGSSLVTVLGTIVGFYFGGRGK